MDRESSDHAYQFQLYCPTDECTIVISVFQLPAKKLMINIELFQLLLMIIKNEILLFHDYTEDILTFTLFIICFIIYVAMCIV